MVYNNKASNRQFKTSQKVVLMLHLLNWRSYHAVKLIYGLILKQFHTYILTVCPPIDHLVFELPYNDFTRWKNVTHPIKIFRIHKISKLLVWPHSDQLTLVNGMSKDFTDLVLFQYCGNTFIYTSEIRLMNPSVILRSQKVTQYHILLVPYTASSIA